MDVYLFTFMCIFYDLSINAVSMYFSYIYLRVYT